MSISRFMGPSTGSGLALMGRYSPLILMVAGARGDRYTSDARFSAMSMRMRSIIVVGAVVAILFSSPVGVCEKRFA